MDHCYARPSPRVLCANQTLVTKYSRFVGSVKTFVNRASLDQNIPGTQQSTLSDSGTRNKDNTGTSELYTLSLQESRILNNASSLDDHGTLAHSLIPGTTVYYTVLQYTP